jgi:DNA-binding transcriptional ArsR family regulator
MAHRVKLVTMDRLVHPALLDLQDCLESKASHPKLMLSPVHLETLVRLDHGVHLDILAHPVKMAILDLLVKKVGQDHQVHLDPWDCLESQDLKENSALLAHLEHVYAKILKLS